MVGVNLTRANLTKAVLGSTDLSYANLSHANLSGANMMCAHLSGAILYGARLQGVNFHGAAIGKANFKGGIIATDWVVQTQWHHITVEDDDILELYQCQQGWYARYDGVAGPIKEFITTMEDEYGDDEHVAQCKRLIARLCVDSE